MGNRIVEGLSSVVIKNWYSVYDGADVYQNSLTYEVVREQVIKIQNQKIFQDLKLRMKEKNPYICRVVFYSHYIHNLYHIFTEQSRKKILIRNFNQWQIHQTNVISAFMSLAERYGPTRVCREMIGVDNNGQIKIWINPNTALCQVLCPCESDLMLADIQSILDQISNSYNFELIENSLSVKINEGQERKKKERSVFRRDYTLHKKRKLGKIRMKKNLEIQYSQVKKIYKKIKQTMKILQESMHSVSLKKRYRKKVQQRARLSNASSNRESFLSKISSQSSYRISPKFLEFKNKANQNHSFYRNSLLNGNISNRTMKNKSKSFSPLEKTQYQIFSDKTRSKIDIKQIETSTKIGNNRDSFNNQLVNLYSKLKQKRWGNKVLQKQIIKKIRLDKQQPHQEYSKVTRAF